MKKLFGLAAAALVACSLFVGCASNEAAGAGDSAGAPEKVHPRSYTFDLIDGGSTCDIVYNQYGPNYQATIDFWKRTKADRPKAGDTVEIYFKGVSDVDLPVLLMTGIVDTSAAANYWTVLTEGDDLNVIVATDIKAGEPIEFHHAFKLAQDPKGSLNAVFVYDSADQPAEYAKVEGPAKITFERVTESTDTANETGEVLPTGPQIYNVALDKYAAFFEIQTNHPWINGAQDMSQISNYEGSADITKAFKDNLPKAGDTIHLTWKASGDISIDEIRCRLVDRSAAAGWWKELSFVQGGEFVDYPLVSDVVAGEPFEIAIDLPVAVDPEEQVSVVVYYGYDAENPAGPSIFKLVR